MAGGESLSRAPSEVREKYLRAFIDELARLRVFTVGLVKLAAERAASSLREYAVGDTPQAVAEALLLALGVEARVETVEDGLKVRVKPKCPLRIGACPDYCPLPHLLSPNLSLACGGKWVPARRGRLFAEVLEGECEFTLVRLAARE